MYWETINFQFVRDPITVVMVYKEKYHTSTETMDLHDYEIEPTRTVPSHLWTKHFSSNKHLFRKVWLSLYALAANDNDNILPSVWYIESNRNIHITLKYRLMISAPSTGQITVTIPYVTTHNRIRKLSIMTQPETRFVVLIVSYRSVLSTSSGPTLNSITFLVLTHTKSIQSPIIEL